MRRRRVGAVLLLFAAAVVGCWRRAGPAPTCTLTSAVSDLASGETTTITATPNAMLTIASADVTVDKGGGVNPASIPLNGVANGTTTFTAANVTEDTKASVGGKLLYTNTGGTFKVDLTGTTILVHPKTSKDVSAVSPATEPAGTTICSVKSTGQGPPTWTYVVDLTTTPGLTLDRIAASFEVLDKGGLSASSPATVTAQGATPGGYEGVVAAIAGTSVTITARATDAKKGGSAKFDITLSDRRRFSLTSVGPKN